MMRAGLRLERVSKHSIAVNSGSLLYSVPEEYCGGYLWALDSEKEYITIFDSPEAEKIQKTLLGFNKKLTTGIPELDLNQLSLSKLAEDRHAHIPQLLEKMVEASRLIGDYKHVDSVQIVYVDVDKNRKFIEADTGDLADERSNSIILNVATNIKRNQRTIGLIKSFAFSDQHSLIKHLADEVLIDSVLGHYRDESLELETIKSGAYNVLFSAETTGFLLHEMLGHLLEADLIYNHPLLLEGKLKLGNRITTDKLTFLDNPLLGNYCGSYSHDDEGVPGKAVELISQGVVTGRLHNSKTAAIFGEEDNGHARSIDYHQAPAARMSVTYPAAGEYNFGQLLSATDNGLYIKNAMLAKNDLVNMILLTKEAYLVENGIVTSPVAPFSVYGDIFDFLSNIQALGNAVEFYDIGCTKGYAESWIPVTIGGCAMFVRNVKVGAV